MKDAIAPEAAVSQSLRVVFEGVGRSLGSGVGNGQRQILFFQQEIDARSGTLDRAGDDIARDPQSRFE